MLAVDRGSAAPNGTIGRRKQPNSTTGNLRLSRLEVQRWREMDLAGHEKCIQVGMGWGIDQVFNSNMKSIQALQHVPFISTAQTSVM